MDNRLRLILVDDHTLFRGGLGRLLENGGAMRVVGEASNGREFLDLLETTPADVVLLDLDMPVLDGYNAAQQALERHPDLRIIVLSMHGDHDYYVRMVSVGARGFLLKSSDVGEVVEAITTVVRGGTYFSRELLHGLVDALGATAGAAAQPALSAREREIVELICKGLSNNEIADKLFISKRTVDKHRANILEKTGSRNTANLVVYAIKNHLTRL